MHVLNVITDMSALGGAERMLIKLTRPLVQAGIRMSIVSLGGKGELGAEAEKSGAAFYALGLEGPRDFLAGVWRLARLIRALQPDLMHTMLYHADLAGLAANALAGSRPLVWNLRCSEIELGPESRVTALVRKALAVLSRCPNAIAANSLAGLESHQSMGYRAREWLMLPNGFDTEEYQFNQAGRDRLRAEWRICPDCTLIGMAARAAPMKDHACFIEAARQLSALRPQTTFALAGAGTEPGSALARKVEAAGLSGKILLLGARHDMPDLFSAFDITTLSSSSGEGFANVIAESMACATPVVATDVGDAREIIGAHGRIVQPRQAYALAQALAALVDLGGAGRREMGLGARASIIQRFRIEIISESYAALFRRLAARCG